MQEGEERTEQEEMDGWKRWMKRMKEKCRSRERK